jgi:protein-tyrosine phosphatase
MSADYLLDHNRVPLQTLYNVRDLGGYLTADGRRTAFGRFLRADAPVRLNQADLLQLLAYPVRTVIDLRSPGEHGRLSHDLRDHPAIDYYNIPLAGDDLDAAIAAVQPFEAGRPTVDLGDFYVHMLENSRDQLQQVFKRLAQAQPGAVLFHCSHGKDRTGLVAALLLLLAGVSDADIIANYQISYTLLKPWFDTFIHDVPAAFLPFFNTNPENMARTLDYIHNRYPSVIAYLQTCGMTDAEIGRLREKLLD